MLIDPSCSLLVCLFYLTKNELTCLNIDRNLPSMFFKSLRRNIFLWFRKWFDCFYLKKCHWDLFHQCELSSSTKGKSRSLGEIRFDENDRIRRPSSLEFNAKENLFDEKHFQMDFDEDQQKILDEFLHVGFIWRWCFQLINLLCFH